VHPAHAGEPELADAGRPDRSADPGRGLGQWTHVAGDDVDHLAFPLDGPVDEQERMPPDDPAQPGPGVRPERDVDHPGLVLERQEDGPLGRHRVLPGDDQAADPDRAGSVLVER